MARMIEMLDQQAKQYLTGISLRSVQVDNLNKLLTTNYQADAKEALKASGFTDSMLSARQLHSLLVNNAASWLVDILSGNWVACPIPKSAGLNQAGAIAWFKEHGQSLAERISTKKALRAKAKADAKANKPEKAEPEETFTVAEVEAAKREGKNEALKQVFAVNAADINPLMILELIDSLDQKEREALLTALAAKYPKTQANKRGEGTAADQQATLIS